MSYTIEADTIHHTTFCPKLRISNLPSDSNARHIKLNQWVNINVLGCANIKWILILVLKDAIRGLWAGFYKPVTYRYEYPQLNIVRVSWESRFDVKFLTPRAWNGETLDGCYWFINIHEIGVFHSLHHTLTHLLIECLNIEAETVHHCHILPHIANFNTPIWH